MTGKKIKELIRKNGVKYLELQFVDINGMAKSTTIPSNHIEKALAGDITTDGSSIQGFRDIETSDMLLVPEKSTFRVLPWNKSFARLICDVYDADKTPFEGCPRCNLKRVIKEAQKLGYSMNAGPEMEFFLFKRDAGGNPTTIPHDKAGYYDIGPYDMGGDLRADIADTLRGMDFDIEMLHHENAPGQHEIDFKYADILGAADNVATFKVAARAVANKHNLHASFMPKPIYGVNGSGMHCNVSIFRGENNMFFDDAAQHKLSDAAKYSIGGLMKHVKGFTAITNPLANSYKRLVPGFEAPVYMAWSMANRSALVRVPAKRGKATRVELRSPDPSCNPYLAFAVILQACMDGIKNKIQPAAPVEENIYKLSEAEREAKGIDSLPGSLGEAIHKMEKSEVAKKALGEHIFKEFLTAKKKEWDDFRKEVSRWEIERYL
ncbi:MAG: type I glutamate--ammonia ligase [Rickettsiales bacterium]|nr:type I glutamate--ammonia ligase [Rickettsiales bacterium]